MLIYIVILLILIYLSYWNDYKGHTAKFDSQYRWVMIMLILLAGLRNHVGSDSIGYEHNFEDVHLLFRNVKSVKDIFTISQPFWNLSLYLVKITTDSFVVFQFFHAIVLNVLVFRFVKKVTPYCFTAITLFFILSWWNLSFEVLRESICVALFLNASLELNEGRYKNYIIYIIYALIATFYHWFAFIPFLLQPILMIANRRWVYLSFAFLFVFVMFFFNDDTINTLLLYAISDSDSAAAKRMMSYTMDYSRYGFININLMGLTKLLLLDVLFPILLVKNNKDHKYSDLLNSMCLLYVFFNMMATKIVISGRFCNYYIIPICVVSSIVLYQNRQIFAHMFVSGLLVLNLLFALITFYLPDNPNMSINYDCRYIPYTSIFQDPDPVRERYYGIY